MTSHRYSFGMFKLDPAARRLWRDGEDVVLPPKVFDCIVYLVEHRERAIGRDELISAVWGSANVSDSVLGQSVLRARRRWWVGAGVLALVIVAALMWARWWGGAPVPVRDAGVLVLPVATDAGREFAWIR